VRGNEGDSQLNSVDIGQNEWAALAWSSNAAKSWQRAKTNDGHKANEEAGGNEVVDNYWVTICALLACLFLGY
jgi:hypothetical protein